MSRLVVAAFLLQLHVAAVGAWLGCRGLDLLEKIQAQLKTLREEREKLLGFKETGEGKSWEYLIEKKRQQIVADFQQLHQFLEEQERLLLAQLEKLEKEIKIQNENVTKLSEQISRLNELISELEGKCQKPPGEFLQEKIQAHLKTLREEREKLLESKMTGEGKSWEYLKQIEKKRQQIVAEFQQLHQFLEEQEQLLLAQLEKLEKEIPKIQDENITKVSEEISCLSELISELEGKCQKPASEFLQDIRSTLSRCEKGKFQQPEEISRELEKRLSDFPQKTVALMETLRKFQEQLMNTSLHNKVT
ncbi:tripartite motif-containing protein 15-like [Mauremys reevesii]|uniref:tripartite motif-containing protein 15-like n=1 Tax=Mauremys reevesii TaxID=260615 RepID=UPI00193F9019|nr:tripartite motif-containing protein 15-like [Mauremys reevesii]